MVQAGFGKGTIHFPESIFPIEGFRGIHDDPHIRLMVLRFEDTTFALLEAELVIVPRSSIDVWREKMSKAFHIPVEQTVVQMTHAITTPHEPGPMGPPHLRPEPTEEDLRKRAIYHEVTDRAVDDAIQEASANMTDAVLGWGNGLCSVNVNCDVQTPFGWWLGVDPEGYTNHEMTVLRVNNTSGQILGIFVSFGMKPAAIDNAGKKNGSRLISSEIAGEFCNRMEALYGVPVIYSVSAGGNQIPEKTALKYIAAENGEVQEIDEGAEAGFHYAKEQAEEMCRTAQKIVNTISCDEQIAQTQWANCGQTWERRRGGPRKLTKALMHIPEGKTELSAEMFLMGNTVFVMVRPEMTAEAERLLQTAVPEKRIVLMTLTNGEMKCLPDLGAFERGTYEAQGSNLMPGAAEALIQKTADTITKSIGL